ncbi:MAG: hypothetical protein PHO92_05145 [Candidatus Peribacteraceae bacterium]|nr:hypothetical protein [Candidatus Peribacteraceae bacterium]
MNRNTTNAFLWKRIALCALLTLVWSGGAAQAEWEECMGKPYGTPGCPILHDETESSRRTWGKSASRCAKSTTPQIP